MKVKRFCNTFRRKNYLERNEAVNTWLFRQMRRTYAGHVFGAH